MVIILLWDTNMLSQPANLKGSFTEVAFKRNENNSGPVIRIYAITVKEPNGADYKGYGDAMPHTLRGNTKVFFFDEKGPVPVELKLDFPYFDTLLYKPIQVYERNGAGVVSLLP